MFTEYHKIKEKINKIIVKQPNLRIFCFNPLNAELNPRPAGNERVLQETELNTGSSNFRRRHIILEHTFHLYQVRVQMLLSQR
jgi:hypothetical protein